MNRMDILRKAKDSLLNEWIESKSIKWIVQIWSDKGDEKSMSEKPK